MSNIYKSITELVGHTPLLELTHFEKHHALKAKILGKLEYFNPSGSVKDRAALNMIEVAEREGRLKVGDEIVEATSGNTGIALAAFAAAKGYKLTVFFEDGGSVERIQILKTYGAKVLYFSDLANEGEELNIDELLIRAQKYADDNHAFFTNQSANENNALAHVKSTGPEIWEDTDGHVDYLVAMSGTGGTLNGLSRYFRSKNKDVKIIGVQAAKDSRFGSATEEFGVIDGVAPFHNVPIETVDPLIKDSSIYDEVIEVSTKEAIAVAHELATTEGLFLGTSAAAALHAASIVAKRDEASNKNVVVILPDNGFKYLSTKVYKVND